MSVILLATKIRELDYLIPNAESIGLIINKSISTDHSYWEVDGADNVIKIDYKFKDQLIMRLLVDGITKKCYKKSVINRDNLVAAENNLISSFGFSSYQNSSYTVLFDSLYYKANPEHKDKFDFSKMSAAQLSRWFRRLEKRINSSFVDSPKTSEMINHLMVTLEKGFEVKSPSKATSKEELIESLNDVKNKLTFDFVNLTSDSISEILLKIVGNSVEKLPILRGALLDFNISSYGSYKIAYNLLTKKWTSNKLLYVIGHIGEDHIPILGHIRFTDLDSTNNVCAELNLTFNSPHGYYDAEHYVIYNRTFHKKSDLMLVTCPCCKKRGYSIELEIVDDIGCNFCILPEHSKIYNYSQRVPELLKFKAKKINVDKLRFLGIELEYETSKVKNDAIITNKSLENHAILKFDGSIGEGFEIVSCPATLEIHTEEYKKFFESKIKTNLKSTKKTGMHVHVSRNSLSSFTIGKLSGFMNNPDNRSYLIKLAGRDENNFSKYVSSKTVTTHLKGDSERYSVLNLDPRHTVEFRLFSTPVNYEEFLTKLEFVDCLCEYCGTASVGLGVKDLLKWTNFEKFILSPRSKEYKHLKNYIKSNKGE